MEKKSKKRNRTGLQRALGERLERFRPRDAVFGILVDEDKKWAEALGISRFLLASVLKGTKEVKLASLHDVFQGLPVPKEWKYWILMGGDEPEGDKPEVEYNGRKLYVKKPKEPK
jgi:hypothetical protein